MKLWIDGCFDFFHHGHANLLLQSKQLSNSNPFVEVGIHSDEAITLNKAAPVTTLNERIVATEANKWCDLVYPDAPYVTSLGLVKSEGCDYVLHGDDITTDKDGNDSYQAIKDAGLMKLVKRTNGVSTTELIAKLLDGIYVKDDDVEKILSNDLIKSFSNGPDGFTTWNNIWFIKQGLHEFQIVDKVNLDSVVYIFGTFDLFNPFHIKALEQFKDQNIVVGILNDVDTVMNLLQRTLCVLQCKYVKNVIIGSTKDFKLGKVQIDINSLENEFSYLKNNGIKKRIEENVDLYIQRQAKKAEKAELEAQKELEQAQN